MARRSGKEYFPMNRRTIPMVVLAAMMDCEAGAQQDVYLAKGPTPQQQQASATHSQNLEQT